jgi:V8-like Glu-specific endopeptidase
VRKAGFLNNKSWGCILRSTTALLMVLAIWVIPNAVGTGYSTEEGAVPSVQAVEVEKIVPVFQAADDGPGLRPNHPPIDQIPPMPMPFPKDQPPVGRGALVVHDAVTGETITLPNDAVLSGGSGTGGGYRGADGGRGIERWPATFVDMIQITNTWDFPWRMNAKLVMRFGTAWYVCSGTMRDAETVLTAGHCVYDYGGYGWADEIWVYPGWDGQGWALPPPNTVNAYGWGHGTYFGSWTGWTDHGNYDYDVGLIGVTRAVGMLTGWFGWAWGGSCSYHLGKTYHNTSYPSQNCPDPGLHNGRDMYYWYGNFDACPDNQLQLNTGGGNCFDTVWGGMSGSGAYYIDDGSRYVHAICSTSNRYDRGYYVRQWEDWVNWTNNTFIPNVRGSSFDLQPLDVNAEPATIAAGSSTTLLNHLATNPTNGTASGTWTFRVYLSTNDFISSFDTLLSTQFYNRNFGTMSSVRVNMVQVTIPVNTPEGNYWIGLEYDSATDGNSGNNNTEGWDSVPITVIDTTPPTPNPMTWSVYPHETSSISMTATTASDVSGVEYYFDETTGNAGGSDSGWQDSASYTDSGLSPGTQYCYRVKARDKSSNHNETGWSSTECVTTGTPAVFRVEKDGDVYADRAYYCGLPSGCFNVGTGADIAEYINVSEPVEHGDVVELDPERPGYYRKSREPYSTLAVGVISTTPGITMGLPDGESQLIPPLSQLPLNLDLRISHLQEPKLTLADLSLQAVLDGNLLLELSIMTPYPSLIELASRYRLRDQPLLALMGVVPVKATTENGPIRPGDLLVSSSTPGHVMRCDEPKECKGAIIGKALEPLKEGTGVIKMLVMR